MKLSQRQRDDLLAWFVSNTETARRNRLTALGGVLGCKPMPQVSSGADAIKASVESAGNGRSEVSLAEGVIPAGSPESLAPKYDGNLIPAMTAMVTGFVDKLAKFYSPCPQGADCAGDGKHSRIFSCDHCSFVGCCSCLDLHEAAGHESDSSTASERIHLVAKGAQS